MMRALALSTAWILTGAVAFAALYWAFINTPESTIFMLALSLLLVIGMAVVLGVTWSRALGRDAADSLLFYFECRTDTESAWNAFVTLSLRLNVLTGPCLMRDRFVEFIRAGFPERGEPFQAFRSAASAAADAYLKSSDLGAFVEQLFASDQ